MQRHWKNDPTNEFKVINDRDIQGKLLRSMKGETWFRFGDSRKARLRHWHLSRARVTGWEWGQKAEGTVFAKALIQERVQRTYGKVSLTFSSGCCYLSPGGYYWGVGGKKCKYKERVWLAFSLITNASHHHFQCQCFSCSSTAVVLTSGAGVQWLIQFSGLTWGTPWKARFSTHISISWKLDSHTSGIYK